MLCQIASSGPFRAWFDIKIIHGTNFLSIYKDSYFKRLGGCEISRLYIGNSCTDKMVSVYRNVPLGAISLHSIYIAQHSVSHKSNQYTDINNNVPVVHTWISHKHSLHTGNPFIIEQTYMGLLGHYMSKCVQYPSEGHRYLTGWNNYSFNGNVEIMMIPIRSAWTLLMVCYCHFRQYQVDM